MSSLVEDRAPEKDGKPVIGGVVAGRYRLDRVLGKGGMGSVWAAWDDDLERVVAIKFMALEIADNPALRERFTSEAKAAARLRTRHVVQVFDYGLDRRTPYIVMEFLDGEDLKACLNRTKRLPLGEVLRIVSHACKALASAREAGIIHRDLKPANIFLARADGEDVVKVLDFGVAKRSKSGERSDTTKSGVVLGSPPYLSPEQARGNPVDHRSDLWALTSVAYRALTGRNPFRGRTDADIIVKICTEGAPPPSQYIRGLPPGIDEFFEKAFQREPDLRFQGPEEFSDALRVAAGREAVASGPTSEPSGPFPTYLTPTGEVDEEPVSIITGNSAVPTGDSLAHLAIEPHTHPSLSAPTPAPWTGTSLPAPAADGEPRTRSKTWIAPLAVLLVVVIALVMMMGEDPLTLTKTAGPVANAAAQAAQHVEPPAPAESVAEAPADPPAVTASASAQPKRSPRAGAPAPKAAPAPKPGKGKWGY